VREPARSRTSHGPEVPADEVDERPASLLDVVPFIMESVGVPAGALGEDLPGQAILSADFEERPVLSQYHATGSSTGAYMIRTGDLKYVHYADPSYPPQLFDIATDPEELVDRAGDPAYADRTARCHEILLGLVDPEGVDRRARADQAQRVEELGGADAILARGDFGYSPPPGVQASFA
jgi:choline-sulfatase